MYCEDLFFGGESILSPVDWNCIHKFYSIMSSKCNSNDAANFEMPKMTNKVLPLSKKMKVFDLIREDNDVC